jgi:hypothetical protein
MKVSSPLLHLDAEPSYLLLNMRSVVVVDQVVIAIVAVSNCQHVVLVMAIGRTLWVGVKWEPQQSKLAICGQMGMVSRKSENKT